MKRGPSLQARAVIALMLKKGLIEEHDETYRITRKGKAYARKLEEAQQ